MVFILYVNPDGLKIFFVCFCLFCASTLLIELRGEKWMGGGMMQRSTFNGTVLSRSIIKL